MPEGLTGVILMSFGTAEKLEDMPAYLERIRGGSPAPESLVEEFQRRYGVAWRGFLEFAKSHIRVVSGRGQAAVERVYLETVEGRTKPDEGHILSLWG